MAMSVYGKLSFVVIFCFLMLLTGYSSALLADYVLTAPPRESPQDGEKVYQPLAAYLSKILGETVVYQHPLTWRNYERRMRNDEFDFVFDGPHFAAWRIESLAARPLVRLPGELQFVLVVNRDDKNLQRIEDLYGRTICTLPAPNLGALSLFSMFPNPVRQPEYHIVNGGFPEAVKAFKSGLCNAVILRRGFYFNNADATFRDSTRVLKKSVAITNQGITVSWRIKVEMKEKILRALSQPEGLKALEPITTRFADNKSKFVPSTEQDYADLNLLRENSVFGW